jgi:hypothetical protein
MAALTPGKRLAVLTVTGYEAGWAPELVWMMWRGQESWLYRESVCSAARSQSLCRPSQRDICLVKLKIINLASRINGFVGFVHQQGFCITRKHNVSETGSVSIFRWREGDAYSVGSFRKCNLRTTFRNVVFSSYVESLMMDKVLKRRYPECYTISLERFRFHIFDVKYKK